MRPTKGKSSVFGMKYNFLVVHLPLAGGAFFIEIMRVATAFRTKDISDNRYLEKEKWLIYMYIYDIK